MKKLLILLIHIITFTPCIFTMATEPINEKALICASKNANISFGQPDLTNACRMICSLGLVNKKLYKQINDDPVATRTIINHLANKYNKTHSEVAHLLATPSARKCNELNDELLNCISEEFYLPNTMEELINKGANPDITLFNVWRQIITPKMPDITHVPITRIMANTSKILNFNNNLRKQFYFLCRQQAFDQKTLTEIQSLKKMVTSMTIALKEFDSLSLSIDNQKVIDSTTILKGSIMKDLLQSLADRLEKNQPYYSNSSAKSESSIQ